MRPKCTLQTFGILRIFIDVSRRIFGVIIKCDHPKPNIMKESSLHASLKMYLLQPGDEMEVAVDGFLVDIKRGDLLLEIQTTNFKALKNKLQVLLGKYHVCVVHPIPVEKWIIRVPVQDYETTKKRKSPKHGRIENLFYEIVSIPHLAMHPNFSLMILMTKEVETRVNDGKGSWRRSFWSIDDHKLLDVCSSYTFQSPDDYLFLLPINLLIPFTTRQLANHLSIPYTLASKMIYSLRMMKLIDRVGKVDRSYLYKNITHE
jgi:hypothetical protein